MSKKNGTENENHVPAPEATQAGPAVAPPTPPVTPGAPAPGETPGPVTPSPTAELESHLAETLDKYLRCRADFDNYRKRIQRDFAELREQTKAMTAQEFLQVYDYLLIARDHAKTGADVQALLQGMELITNEFSRALSTLGIETVTPAGEVFDPTAHEAAAQEPSADVPAGKIVRVWKCGFRVGERLLRPAVVVVSSGVLGAAVPGVDSKPQNP